MGVKERVCEMQWNGKAVRKGVEVEWDDKSEVLNVVGLQSVTSHGAWMEDWALSWRSRGC